MLSLLLYCSSFITSGILAYKVTVPVHREDLGNFIVSWLIFVLFTHRLGVVKDTLNCILGSISNWREYRLEYKGGSLFYPPLIGAASSLLGLLMWMLMRPSSVWDAVSFVMIWQLLSVLVLSFFFKTVRRS